MYNDDVTENWDKFVAKLSEAPRADWGDWSDAAEQAGPPTEQKDGSEEVGNISLTVSRDDVRTIQRAIKKGLDESGILAHILDELNPGRNEGGHAAGPDGPDGPYIINQYSR
jgi:hypothetical protein